MPWSKSVRRRFRQFALGWGLWLVAAEAMALVVAAAPPSPVPPAYLGIVVAPGQFLLPIQATGAAGLQDWRFDLRFDAGVVQRVDPGGLYGGVYGAEFNGATPLLSDIASAGFDLGGLLDDVAGFSGGATGDGLLAFIAFEFLPGQAGRDPGFQVGDASPPQGVPEPATAALVLGALIAWLPGHRRRRSGSPPPVRAWCCAALAAGAVGQAVAQTAANGSYYAMPSWSQTLPAASRFVVLSNFNSQAVLDRETGLVWERAPSPSAYPQIPPPGTFGGTYADDHCTFLKIGGRMGWRLPSLSELASLIDTAQTQPALPSGHPFQLGGNRMAYWTSTLYYPERYAAGRRLVDIHAGTTGATEGGSATAPAWCVRGSAPSAR